MARKGTRKGFEDAIKKFSEIKKPDAELFYLRTNAHLKLADTEHNRSALTDITQALEKLKEDKESHSKALIPELYYKRAFAHHMLGENELALGSYSSYLQSVRDQKLGSNMLAKGYLGRGLVYESMQMMNKAKKYISKAVDLSSDRSPYYKYCLERVTIFMSKQSDDVANVNQDANHDAAQSESDQESEIDEYEQQNEIQTSAQEAPTDFETFQKLFYEGLTCIEKQDYKEALEKFTQSLEHAREKSDKANSLFRKGICCHALNQNEEAKKAFGDAFKCDPEHARAQFRLGMIQASENLLQVALKNLTSAIQIAPNQVDILHERANVFEKMDKIDEAIYDRCRAMQLVQITPVKIVQLEDRVRHLKAEILQNGESPMSYFEIGWIQQILYEVRKRTKVHETKGNQKDELSANDPQYKETVEAYKMVMKTDKEHLFPEARALLALFQSKGEELLDAQDTLQKLFDMFEEYRESRVMWKFFVKNIKNQEWWIKMEVVPSEEVLKKIINIEKIRQQDNLDEETFKNNENLLTFYQICRRILSNQLSAMALCGCPKTIIAHNLKSSYAKYVCILKDFLWTIEGIICQ